MNRLLKVTAVAAASGKKLFCAFTTLGYPSVRKTEQLVMAFEKEGVDIVELGFPFSDPLADGPTIQFSSEQALAAGATLKSAFDLAKKLRKNGCEVPLVFFTYFNPVFHHGCKKFLKEAREAGFDAILVPDLPPDQEEGFRAEAAAQGLPVIFLIAPTSDSARTRMIAQESQGFIYYVSLRGVTGARQALPSEIRRHLKEIKKATNKPVLVGFGVSKPEQARSLSQWSDGVIVGSAIIDRIRKANGRIEPAVSFIREMVRAVKGAPGGR